MRKAMVKVWGRHSSFRFRLKSRLRKRLRDDCPFLKRGVDTDMSLSEKRILLVDDNAAIHEDFKHILSPAAKDKDTETRFLEEELFGEKSIPQGIDASDDAVKYIIDDAHQGEEAVAMVDEAVREGRPYALAFMDVRMPPGIDGIQTIQQIWQKHAHIEMVICTAYSDYSWDQIMEKFGRTDHLMFIKKPFDAIAVKQIALSLTTKWDLDKKNREHQIELEKEVEYRTDELKKMVEHLSELKARAEADTLAKSMFLSNVSHEIRTPLNGIMGMTELLLDTELDEDQKNYTDAIKKSGDSLAAMVNDVLDYPKLEADKTPISHIDFDIRTAVEDVAELMSIRAQEKGLELAALFHAGVPEILVGDPERIRQILLNLTGNAIKFTEKGEVFIQVSLDPHGTAAGDKQIKLLFEVSDTGIGIAPQVKAKIFQSFEQADELISRQFGGTGLGLAISKKLVELMGGEIDVESEPESGSTFRFTALLDRADEIEPRKISPEKNLYGARILVLSDNPTSRKVLSLYTTHWGGNCFEAETLEQAIEVLHTSADSGASYDVTIVDYKGGDLERYVATAQEIHTYQKLINIPLVCLTAKARRGDAQFLQNHGYRGYLTKPIKQSHLYNALALLKGLLKNPQPTSEKSLITKHLAEELCNNRLYALIVDDNIVNRKILTLVLEKQGIRCDVAHNGREAVDAAAEKQYDILFMDCRMPVMDGYEATQLIRQSEKGTAVPIIAVTAAKSREEREKCIVAGMNEFISKPFKASEIVKIIAHLVEKQS
ncbi:MAG: response regulator [Chitinivibrionales bacterium]|nr:response regulator [Chitinivibrionales bacterium]